MYIKSGNRGNIRDDSPNWLIVQDIDNFADDDTSRSLDGLLHRHTRNVFECSTNDTLLRCGRVLYDRDWQLWWVVTLHHVVAYIFDASDGHEQYNCLI